jgi:hypothetical protein
MRIAVSGLIKMVCMVLRFRRIRYLSKQPQLDSEPADGLQTREAQ